MHLWQAIKKEWQKLYVKNPKNMSKKLLNAYTFLPDLLYVLLIFGWTLLKNVLKKTIQQGFGICLTNAYFLPNLSLKCVWVLCLLKTSLVGLLVLVLTEHTKPFNNWGLSLNNLFSPLCVFAVTFSVSQEFTVHYYHELL